MKKIIAVFALALAVLVSAPLASAQEPGKVYRIGFITAGSPVRTFKLWLAAFL